MRDRRPGDLPAAANRENVREIELSFPEPEEQRYILGKVQQFAASFAAAIPEPVRERAQYFDPPILAPSEQQILNEPELALRSLESITKHLKFDRQQLQTYERLLEDVRYVVEASSRAILGLGKEDKTEFQHVLRTLSSATRSFTRFMDPIEEGLKKIKLPEPPPPPLPKDGNMALDADQAAKTRAPIKDFFRTIFGEVATVVGGAYKRLAATCAVKWDGFCAWAKRTGSWCKMWLSRGWDVTRAGLAATGKGIAWAATPLTWTVKNGWKLTCYLAQKTRDGIVAAKNGIIEGAKMAKNAIVEHGGRLGKAIGAGLDWLAEKHPRVCAALTVGAIAGATALLGAAYAQLGWWMPFDLTAGQLATAAGLMAAGIAAFAIGRKAISRFWSDQVVGGTVGAASATAGGFRSYIYNPIADTLSKFADSVKSTDLYHKLFARGRSTSQTRNYSFMSSDVVSYFKRGSRRAEHACRVESQDRKFWDKMGVLDVHILDKEGGSTIQLDRFFEKLSKDPEKKEQVEEIRKHFYRTKQFEQPDLAAANVDETIIKMPVIAGRMSILLPLGYEVTGVTFLDKRDKPLDGKAYPIEVEECALGSAKVEVPVGARTIAYRVRQGEFKVPPLQIERFKRLLPGIGSFKGIEGEAYAQALAQFNLPKSEEMKLLFNHQVDRGFKVVDDSFVRSFLETAGSAVAESVGGMRLGNKDSLSYYSACMFNANGVPSVLISGLVPDSASHSYPLKTGHSQTAVLTEDGALVCDLSDKAGALKETGSDSLLMRERLGLLRKLNGLNYHQIFDYASEVREVITRKGKELPLFHSLLNALYNWTGFGIPFVRRAYKDSKVEQSIQTDFDQMKVPKEERAVRALSKKLALENCIDYCRRQGAVTQVHYFYRENRAIPPLRQEDIRYLPPEHKDLADYDVRARVVDFTSESLRSEAFSAVAKRASVDWISSRLPTKKAVLDYSQGLAGEQNLNRFFYGGNSEEILTTEELVRMLDKQSIAKLTEDQSKSLLFGALALPLAPVYRGHSTQPGQRQVDPATLAEIAERGLLLAQKLEGSGIPFTRKEKEAIAILSANIGSTLLEWTRQPGVDSEARGRFQEAILQCAKTTSVVTGLGQSDQVSFFYDLLMENQSPLAASLVSFAKSVGRDALFGTREGEKEIDQHLRTLGARVTRTFCERQLADQNLPNWWQTLEFFESLQLSPSAYADQDRIKRHLQRELHREWRKGEIKIGYPDEVERPISFLCSKLIDKHSVDRIRIGQTLVKHGLMIEGDLKEIWPEVREGSVMNLLLKEAEQITQEDPAEDLFYGCRKAELSQPLAVGEIQVLASELLGSDLKPLQAAIAYNSFKRGTRHWAETAMESLKERFPAEWRSLVGDFDSLAKSRLVGRVLRDLYTDVPPDAAYRGLLAYAAAGVEKDPSALVNSAIDSLSALSRGAEPALSERASAAVRALMGPCDRMYPPFNGLDSHAKTAGLIGGALLSAIQGGGRDEAKKKKLFDLFGRWGAQQEDGQPTDPAAAKPDDKQPVQIEVDASGDKVDRSTDVRTHATARFFGDKGINKHLYRIVDRRVPMSGKTVESAVWRELFKPTQPGAHLGWDLSVLAQESRQRADMIQTRFREALPQFLYSRAGCVLVNATSGDFRGYRGYAEGDSLRQIDWKRSIKDGELSVRLRDEEEARGIRLVLDTEHLVNAYNHWRQLGTDERAKHDNPLRELFVLCHLAARENVQVDIALYSRSHMATFEGVVERSSSAPRGNFRSKSFIAELERHLRSAHEIYQAEKKIYGEEGMQGVDIFAARDLPVKKGQLHLFGVAARNEADSYVQRANLSRRRVLSASFGETRAPRPERKVSDG